MTPGREQFSGLHFTEEAQALRQRPRSTQQPCLHLRWIGGPVGVEMCLIVWNKFGQMESSRGSVNSHSFISGREQNASSALYSKCVGWKYWSGPPCLAECRAERVPHLFSVHVGKREFAWPAGLGVLVKRCPGPQHLASCYSDKGRSG